MNASIQGRMAEILSLTRTGRLQEATALIKGALGGLGDDSAVAARSASPVDLRAGVQFALPAPDVAVGQPVHPERSVAAAGMQRCRFEGHDGGLDYLLYVPTHVRASLPLVVMLHGCTQSAEDFARGTRMNELAEEVGFVVAYPEQPKSANAQKCWNWFRPGDQSKNQGEPALIAGVTGEIISRHRIDPNRVYVAGLSAGGAAAAIMADAYPDIFAAVGVHSGLACGSANNLPSAFAAMQGKGARRSTRGRVLVPVITFHGDQDHTVSPANSDQIHAAFASLPDAQSLTSTTEQGTASSGRRYRRTSLVDRTGRSFAESWHIAGAGHAWAGGSPNGSYTDKSGPDASREMVRFFLQHGLPRTPRARAA